MFSLEIALDAPEGPAAVSVCFLDCNKQLLERPRCVKPEKGAMLSLQVVVAGAAIHLVFLAANMTAVRLLGIGRARSATASGGSAAQAAVGVQRAVILVTSQKTLPVRMHTNDCLLRRDLDQSWVDQLVVGPDSCPGDHQLHREMQFHRTSEAMQP